MLSEKAETHAPSNLYLIVQGGCMVLRINSSIVVGEDAAGDLALNSTGSCAQVEIEYSGNRLSLRALQPDLMLCEAGERSREVAFEFDGSVELSLPGNRLTMSDEFVSRGSGAIIRHISLARELITQPSPDTSPFPVDEALILLEEPQTREIDECAVNIPLLLTSVSSASTTQTMTDRTISDEVIPTLTIEALPVPCTAVSEPAFAEPANPTPSPAGRFSIMPWITLSLVVLVAVSILQFAGYDSTDSKDHTVPTFAISTVVTEAPPHNEELFESVSSLLATSQPIDATTDAFARQSLQNILLTQPDHQGASDLIAHLDAFPAPEDAPQDAPVDVPKEAIDRGSQDAGDQQPELLSVAAPELFTAEMAQAEALFLAGSIVWPVDQNAVKILEQILYQDPHHAGALQLIFRCADQLMNEAKAAQAAGDVYAARNLVEEVLAFHPQYEEARILWNTLAVSESTHW